MLKGVSTSDWHLTGGITRLFPHNALQKQLEEIEKPFKYCIENDINHIFMPGDLSDKARIDEETFIALIALLMKYDKYVSFRYILGNHDFAHVGKTAMDVLEVFIQNSAFKNVHLYRKPTIEKIDGVDVCFMPFPHNETPKNNRGSLVFAHIEEQGALGDNGLPLKSQGLKLKRSKKDFIISGHLHTYQYLKERRTIFNGSLYQKTFGESLPKGFIEFKAKYFDNELKVQHSFVNSNPRFCLQNLKIEDNDQWNTLQEGESILYKITVGEDVVIPKGITKQFPNIISLNGVTYKGRTNLDIQEKTSVNDIPKITPLTGLVKYLKRYDLTKQEIKRAVEMVREAIDVLNKS